jgi:hypothetical protein
MTIGQYGSMRQIDIKDIPGEAVSVVPKKLYELIMEITDKRAYELSDNIIHVSGSVDDLRVHMEIIYNPKSRSKIEQRFCIGIKRGLDEIAEISHEGKLEIRTDNSRTPDFVKKLKERIVE